MLGVAGLSAGVKWVQEQGLDKIHHQETELADYLSNKIDEIGGYKIPGHRDWSKRVATVSFRLESDMPDVPELSIILDRDFGIAVRPGLHCAPYIHRALGTFPDGAIRVSIGPFNTREHIDALAGALAEMKM